MNLTNPIDKCGYESIWMALKCKKSPLIHKYNLNKMTDIYELLHGHNDKYPKLFEDKNVNKFYEKFHKKSKDLRDFKTEFNKKGSTINEGAIWNCFFPLVSIYFNMELIIKNKESDTIYNTNKVFDFISLPRQKRILNVNLLKSPNHIEYIPEEHEKNIFKKLDDNLLIEYILWLSVQKLKK
tara:strand:- start:1919 stop:2464 length:546 start_codon:yes stop_codon:yes gene_type:complete